MITYAAVLVAIYYSLSLFGVHTRTILAGAGILGIVISFGAQSTIADILSGMFLIFEDVIHMCQRNDICLARSYTVMEPIVEPAAGTDETHDGEEES